MENIKFPHPVSYNIQWGEMDALGHVNNVQYIRYFETARIAFFHFSDIWKVLDDLGIYFILAKIDCSFKQPLIFPDKIILQAGIISIGNTSMTLLQQVISESNGIAAFGEAIVVCMDKKINKPIAIPEAVRNLITQKYLPQSTT